MKMPDRKRLTLFVRITAGVTMYCVFAILAVSAAVTDSMDARAIVLSVLLVGSFLILPRRVKAREDEDERAHEQAAHIQKWLTWVRVAFFALAAFIFVVLPGLL